MIPVIKCPAYLLVWLTIAKIKQQRYSAYYSKRMMSLFYTIALLLLVTSAAAQSDDRSTKDGYSKFLRQVMDHKSHGADPMMDPITMSPILKQTVSDDDSTVKTVTTFEDLNILLYDFSDRLVVVEFCVRW